jgi:hypothetical protein
MRNNRLIISLSLTSLIFFSLFSCSSSTHEYDLIVNYAYDVKEDSAVQLYQGAYLVFEDNGQQVDHLFLVPGDKAIVNYKGDLYCTESYPGNCTLASDKFVSISYVYTTIREIDMNDVREDVNDGGEPLAGYGYYDEYVIMDKETLSYIPLSEYDSDILYASEDTSRLPEKGDLEPFPLGGLFAFNPRESIS